MNESEARLMYGSILVESVRQHDDRDVHRLLQELGCLRLAILQAATDVARIKITTAEYLQLYLDSKAQRQSFLSKNVPSKYQTADFPQSVMNTWQISFDYVKEKNELSARILRAMCLFDSFRVPRDLLHQTVLVEMTPATVPAFIEALGLLKALSFISEPRGDRTFDMHSLLNFWTRMSLRDWQEVEDEACQNAIKTLPKGTRTFELVVDPMGIQDYVVWLCALMLNEYLGFPTEASSDAKSSVAKVS